MTKDRGPSGYSPDNVGPDGRHVVGKGRPPESGKFRSGDGRQRGRRTKGTKNLATDLMEELDSRVTVTVGGSSKKITRQRAILMRLADNATKGQNPAIAMTLAFQQRLVDPLLAKQEEARRAKNKVNFSLLSLDERRAMDYFFTKAMGEKYNGTAPGIIYARLLASLKAEDGQLALEAGGEGVRESEEDPTAVP